ncbi:hypothetical protein EVAR_50191_1 [Eumeta japonica]|uniref:Uncharacterized protein n=1 Tax=Eumeta variegata TaxID=151549 RepID=A0A4C1WW74_EUMVA|nr:hypothetical protein EVAR_50191_1 [Eumeta japonica]
MWVVTLILLISEEEGRKCWSGSCQQQRSGSVCCGAGAPAAPAVPSRACDAERSPPPAPPPPAPHCARPCCRDATTRAVTIRDYHGHKVGRWLPAYAVRELLAHSCYIRSTSTS